MAGSELVVLFADADAERFVTKLIARGVARRCLRNFAWQAVRDPMHDARVATDPAAALGPFLRDEALHFIILWDHHGSGREDVEPSRVEADVKDALSRVGVDKERVAAIAFDPEFEIALVPVWDRVLAELAKKRSLLHAATVTPDEAEPKQSLRRALNEYRLRASPPLFEELASSLSLERLKMGNAIGRLAEVLVRWFRGDDPAPDE